MLSPSTTCVGASFKMPTSTTGPGFTVVCTVDVLSPGVSSSGVTTPVLSTVPTAVVLTVNVKVLLAPTARSPALQVKVVVPAQPAPSDTRVVVAGRLSVTTTLGASTLP